MMLIAEQTLTGLLFLFMKFFRFVNKVLNITQYIALQDSM